MEETKQETLEEAAERYAQKVFNEKPNLDNNSKIWLVGGSIVGFKDGAKWQQERSYSEEEALNLLTHFVVEIQRQNKKGQYPIEIKNWFERNKEKFKKK